MWNTKDLQNSISKQILTLSCQLVVFWNYLSHSQPWNAFEKPVVCFSQRNSWACSAYQACWECTLGWTAVVVVEKAKLHQSLTLGWTCEGAVKAIWIDQQEKLFQQPFQPYPNAVTRGSRSLREEDGSLKTALSIFPDCRTSFISDVVYTSIHDMTLLWLYLLVLANGLFLYYISNGSISLWTDSRIQKGPIYSQLVLCTKKPHTKQKSDEKFDKTNYGNVCKSRDLEAQNKMLAAIPRGSHTQHGAVVLLKPVLFWLRNC